MAAPQVDAGETVRASLREALDAVLRAPDEVAFRIGFARLLADLVNGGAGVLFEAGPDGGVVPCDAGSPLPTWLGAGAAAARKAFSTGRGVVRPVSAPAGSARQLLAQPVPGPGDTLRFVAVVDVPADEPMRVALSRERLELASRLLLAWSGARKESDESAPRALLAVIDLAASVLEAARGRDAAQQLCDRIAVELGCQRVSLGWMSLDRLAPVALAHAPDFERHAPALDERLAAMECVREQDVELLAAPGQDDALPALRALAQAADGRFVLGVPLRVGGRPRAVLLLERAAGAFEAREMASLRTLAELVAAPLDAALRLDRPAHERLHAALVERLAGWREPAGSGRRALGVIVALLAVALAVVPVPHWIDAPATIEASARRLVSAPFDARLLESKVEPGDRVVAGETVIATLETRELELELERVTAERRRLEKDADSARVAGDPSRQRIALFAAERARAEADLLGSQLERAVLVAPISGVLLSSDLRQRLGAPLERGEVLAEIAPLDELRAELAVSESDLALVELEQPAELRTRSEPGTPVALRIARVEPHPLPDDSRGAFRVVARIDELPAGLEALPGMRGVAEVRVGRAPLLWIWLRPAVQALRLWSFH